jgi:hypothetical protein
MQLVDPTCVKVEGCLIQCASVASDGTRATLVTPLVANRYKMKWDAAAYIWDYYTTDGTTDALVVATAGSQNVAARKAALGYTSISVKILVNVKTPDFNTKT